MRVLYLTNNPSVISTNSSLGAWLRLLRPQGLDPVLVSSASGEFQAWAAEENIPTYQVSADYPSKHWPFPFMANVLQLVRAIKRHRIELVHCNQHEIYPLAQYAARLAGVPVVVSVRFTLEREFASYLFAGRKQPRKLIFTSQGSLKECSDALRGVVPKAACTVVHNGKDIDQFTPDMGLRQAFREQHGLGASVALGVACALRPVKQLEQTFEAVSRLPGLPRMFLAGFHVPGFETYAAEIVKRGSEVLGDRFCFLGHVADLRPMFNGIDLFVNTSQAEGFPNSVLESLACGCPVVGYPSTSVDEAIAPGDGGQIVTQNDVTALSAALTEWISSPRRLNDARLRARRCGEHYDIRNSARLLWSQYQAIVEGAAA